MALGSRLLALGSWLSALGSRLSAFGVSTLGSAVFDGVLIGCGVMVVSTFGGDWDFQSNCYQFFEECGVIMGFDGSKIW